MADNKGRKLNDDEEKENRKDVLNGKSDKNSDDVGKSDGNSGDGGKSDGNSGDGGKDNDDNGGNNGDSKRFLFIIFFVLF